MSVSVIVPSYNMGDFLPNAVDSVLTGTLQEVEVLVIDDGSVDGTREVMSAYTEPSGDKYDPRVRYVYQENSGKAAALNKGIRLFSGTHLAILDADDELPSDSIERRFIKAKGEGSPSDCVIGGFSIIDQVGGRIGERKAPDTSDSLHLRNQYFFGYKTPFHLCTCLLHRDLIHRVGLFDCRISRVDDLDYALRILKEASRIDIVNGSVYRYRKYRTDISERLRYRWATLTQRPRVYWKNASPLKAPVAVSAGMFFDIGKGLHEILIGNFDH